MGWMAYIFRLRQQYHKSLSPCPRNVLFMPNSIEDTQQKTLHCGKLFIKQVGNAVRTWGRRIAAFSQNRLKLLEGWGFKRKEMRRGRNTRQTCKVLV
jgi:hypothetical protein